MWVWTGCVLHVRPNLGLLWDQPWCHCTYLWSQFSSWDLSLLHGMSCLSQGLTSTSVGGTKDPPRKTGKPKRLKLMVENFLCSCWPMPCAGSDYCPSAWPTQWMQTAFWVSLIHSLVVVVWDWKQKAWDWFPMGWKCWGFPWVFWRCCKVITTFSEKKKESSNSWVIKTTRKHQAIRFQISGIKLKEKLYRNFYKGNTGGD